MDMQAAGDLAYANHRRSIERANRAGWMHEAGGRRAAESVRRTRVPRGLTAILEAVRTAVFPIGRAKPMQRLGRTGAR